MENREDKLLKSFFEQNKVEIPDGNFSKQLRSKLLEKERNTDWIVLLFTLIGMIISMFLADIREVIYKIFDLIAGFPFVYLMAGIMIFPIIILFLYFYKEKERAF